MVEILTTSTVILKLGIILGKSCCHGPFFRPILPNLYLLELCKALKEVEAFALMGDDLKAVVSRFRLQGKELRHTLRFYSLRWRTWAACFIQAAWRQHHRKKQEKIGWEKEMEYKDRFAEIGGSKISFGAAIFASKFAANAVHLLQRNSTQSTMLRQAYRFKNQMNLRFLLKILKAIISLTGRSNN